MGYYTGDIMTKKGNLRHGVGLNSSPGLSFSSSGLGNLDGIGLGFFIAVRLLISGNGSTFPFCGGFTGLSDFVTSLLTH